MNQCLLASARASKMWTDPATGMASVKFYKMTIWDNKKMQPPRFIQLYIISRSFWVPKTRLKLPLLNFFEWTGRTWCHWYGAPWTCSWVTIGAECGWGSLLLSNDANLIWFHTMTAGSLRISSIPTSMIEKSNGFSISTTVIEEST